MARPRLHSGVQLTFDQRDEPLEHEALRASLPVADAELILGQHDLRGPLATAVRWARETGRAVLTARELQRGPYSLKTSARLCELVLERLAELGWARRLPDTECRGPGRPRRPSYELNLPDRGTGSRHDDA